MNNTQNVDLTKLSADELTQLRGYVSAQITVAAYQKIQSAKQFDSRISNLTDSIAAIDNQVTINNTPAS